MTEEENKEAVKKEEESRLQIINENFPLIVSLKETKGLAIKNPKEVTYVTGLNMLYDLDKERYNAVAKALRYKREPQLYKYFYELAAIEGKPIQELVENDLKRNRTILDKWKYSPNNKAESIQKRVMELTTLLSYIAEPIKPLIEDTVLNRDSFKASREEFGAKFIAAEDAYTDYELPNDGILRLRLLHRTKAETKTGVDLVYEQHDVVANKMRVAVFQYKMWDDRHFIYGNADIRNQLKKMGETFCDSGLCACGSSRNFETSFRMPFCSSFLRPTDKIQRLNSKLVTTGYHIPVCAASKLLAAGKLTYNDLSGKVINHEIFEHLFNHGLVGSDWRMTEEIEVLYKQSHILDEGDTIKVYAQQKIGKRDREYF